MPELPDVEVFRSYFESTSLKQDVEQVDVLDQRILEDISAKNLHEALAGYRFISTTRHGKYMFAKTEGNTWLVLHFGMTGYLHYLTEEDDPPRHTRVLFTFDGENKLAFVDQRILGLVGLTEDPEAFARDRDLGPDALQIKIDEFKELLSGRRGTIKAALTNQAIIAGIGNIYADEILFQSKIHPKTQLSSLSDDDLETLYDQIQTVCQAAIDAEVDVDQMPDWFLLRHREAGERCPRCGAEIETVKVSSRTTYFCPKCQPKR
jgi:formamidopyrimidine-DNA glycosylase